MTKYNSGAVVVKDADPTLPGQRFQPWQTPHEKYRVSVDEYRTFHEQGFLIVKGLVPKHDVEMLLEHTEELMDGKIVLPGIEPPAPTLSRAEKAQHYLRIHMLHRVLALHEQFLLHPRILDVLEALIGPDVMALQTMLFLKGPGKPGQGYHQDSYYIKTTPDTLCGAWLALDRADLDNGCLWMTVGSQHEPIYPPKESEASANGRMEGLFGVDGVSDPDETKNDLTKVAARYAGREVPAIVDPGDVVFFGGHILHRSHANRTKDRFRRAFVAHYANARSFTTWRGGNREHILARGDTHLPFAKPRFGTPCAALLSPEERAANSPSGSSMMGGAGGMMDMLPHGSDEKHDK